MYHHKIYRCAKPCKLGVTQQMTMPVCSQWSNLYTGGPL